MPLRVLEGTPPEPLAAPATPGDIIFGRSRGEACRQVRHVTAGDIIFGRDDATLGGDERNRPVSARRSVT